jgi:hypothetical protein
MKKGLLSILAASDVLVGCQNYDDQFDALNTQITQLNATVDGLAGVQSDVAALKGLINSLQGAVDSVNSDLSAQLTEALADIEAVEAAVADVASGEDLAAVQEDLDSVGTDVEALLESDSFFNGPLTINSDATLIFAETLGQKVKVINGAFTVTGWEGMDSAAVNAITAQMLTITGDINVRMPSQSYAAITFPELTSAANVIMAQAGSYSLPKLVSAIAITFGNNYSSKVTIVDLRALTTVTTLNTATVAADYTTSAISANTLQFDEAEEMHLTSIGYYAPKTLTLELEEGGTLDLSAFKSQDSEDKVRSVSLDVTGASSVVLPNYKNGSFTATDVETVELAEFYGNVTIEGVENITLGKSAQDITINDTATLAAATINGITAPEDTTDKTGPVLSLLNQTNVETVNLTGLFTSVDLTGASNLTDLVMTATTNSLTLVDNGDLNSVDLEGAKIAYFTLDNADDLTEVTLAYTVATGKPNGQTAAITAGTLAITGNAKLTSVSVPNANLIKTLTIQNNAKLESIDFAKLKAVGATTDKANVLIGGIAANLQNKLNASKITDKVDPALTDIGSIESETKIETLKTYLAAAVKVPGTSGVIVYLDSADLFVLENDGAADTERNNLEITTVADQDELTVVNVTADDSTGDTVRQTDTFVFDLDVDAAKNYTPYVAGDVLDVNYDLIASKQFKVTDTYLGNSVDDFTDLVAYFNGSGNVDDFTVTMARDAGHTAFYRITYLDAAGAPETVSVTGNIKFLFGTASYAANVTATNGAAAIASSIAGVINGLLSYTASADGNGFIQVSPNVMGAGPGAANIDLSPNPLVSLPASLSIYNVDTDTDAILSATSTNGATTTYALSVGAKMPRNSVRVTIQNDLTGANRGATLNAGNGKFASTASSTLTSAGAGANMREHTGFDAGEVNTYQYVATFAQIDTAVPVPGSAVNKTGWLD